VPLPADVAHLLRRAGFGGSNAQVATLAAQPWATTVDQLLDFSSAPADVQPAYLTNANAGDWEKEYQLQQWWIDRMATSTTPLQEKLTLFWHGHFATANYKVADMLLMYQQNALFRANATGNFRDLVHSMSLQPAMLIWLDNDPNEKGSPNENFARELMELFTLGVNQYTQDDVVASARAWTGHNTLDSDREQYHFYASRHDTDMKTFMGVTQNWDGPDIIDAILGTDATHKQIAARYIATKMWTFFAYPDPEPDVVTDLATAFLANDLLVEDLVRAIFMHPNFVSTPAKQGLVRSPAEWVAASLRVVETAAEHANPQWYMEDMGQQLFEPPNVSGWRPNDYWLTTSRLWARATWANNIVWQQNVHGADVQNTLSAITTKSVPDAIQYGFDSFGIDNPSAHTRSKLETWLAAQRADNQAWVNWTFIHLLTLLMLSPEFNLA
jgi:uncharacterized protein (DUF1800 family)